MKARDWLGHLCWSAATGLLAGASVGLVEVLSVVLLSGNASRLHAMLWAVVGYGLLGGLGGLGLGLFTGVLCRKLNRPAVYALTWTLAFVVLGLPLARYRLFRDLFHESIRTLSVQGLLFHLGLLLAFALIFALLIWLWQRPALRPVTHTKGSLIAFAILALVAGIVTLLTRPTMTLATPPDGIPPGLEDAPNVILLVPDTLRADRLSSYGYTGSATPHMDSLAEDGVLYAEMTAQASWTKPSFGTILSGLYPSTHTATGKPHSLPQEVLTLAEALAAGGYHNGGVISNVQISSAFGYDQGFADYFYLEPVYTLGGNEHVFQLALHLILRRVTAMLSGEEIYIEDFYQDASEVNEATLEWLAANKDTRFFLFVQYMDPHDPYFEHPYNGFGYARASNQNPDPALAPTFSQLYDGEVRYLDDYVGQLFDWLKAEGLYEQSLIILTSDHGEEFQEHGGWWHGTTLYQEQIAVPLIVKYPENAQAGSVVTDLARSLDIAPTVLDLAGIPIPEMMVGRSLWGETEPPDYAFAEENHEGNVLQSLRSRSHKLIVANEDNPRGLPARELFDLTIDPGEQQDLMASQADQAAVLWDALRQVLTLALEQALAGEIGPLDASVEEQLRDLGY